MVVYSKKALLRGCFKIFLVVGYIPAEIFLLIILQFCLKDRKIFANQ